MSRRGHTFAKFTLLATVIAHSVRTRSAVLDGEIVCLDRDGRSNFYKLLFRRERPYFYAFDLLSVDGDDLRDLPLIERKRTLRRVMPHPRVQSRLLYIDDLRERGVALIDASSPVQ